MSLCVYLCQIFLTIWTPFNNCRHSRHGNRDHLAQLLGNKMADTEGVADSSGYNSSGEEDSEASEGTPLELYGGQEQGFLFIRAYVQNECCGNISSVVVLFSC